MIKSIIQVLNPNKNTESPIEQLLFEEFKRYGLNPIIQYPIGIFRIDLAFPDIKLGIEADGHNFHTSKDQIAKDTYRQKKIESYEWKIERFTGKEIYRYKDFIVSKIALKYFKDVLSEENKKKALGRLSLYFIKNGNRDLGIEIAQSYLNGGYVFRDKDGYVIITEKAK